MVQQSIAAPDMLPNMTCAARNKHNIAAKLPSRNQAAVLLLIVALGFSCALEGSMESVSTKMKSTRFKRPVPISMATSRSTASTPC